MMIGKPIAAAASRHPSAVVERADRGVRMPAASTCSFINPLSRNAIAWRDVESGHADRLAQAGGGDDERLPQRLDEVDVVALQRVQHGATAPASSNQLSMRM